MFCDRCGIEVQSGQAFCTRCGKPFGLRPMRPVQGRIAGHVRLLGIFWLALSAFRLIPAVALLVISQPELHIFHGPEFVPYLMRMLGFAFLAIGAAGIAAGWGLLQQAPWARMLAIVIGCASLVDMPFGTGVGIYTLWVLLPESSEAEYRQLARVA